MADELTALFQTAKLKYQQLCAFAGLEENEKDLKDLRGKLESGEGSYTFLVKKCEELPRTTGWIFMWDSIAYYQIHIKVNDQTAIQTTNPMIAEWLSANPNQDLHPLFGYFVKCYEAMDQKFNTDFFTTRRDLVSLFEGNTLEWPLLAERSVHEIAATKALLQNYGAVFVREKQASKEWVTAFFNMHCPERVGEVDKLLEGKAMEMQKVLRLELIRQYDKEAYIEIATWSPAHPPSCSIREALRMFFTHHKPYKLTQLEELMEAHEPKSMVDRLIEIYEPAYVEKWASRKQRNLPLLFPPWRNDDFPTTPDGEIRATPSYTIPKDNNFKYDINVPPGNKHAQPQPQPQQQQAPPSGHDEVLTEKDMAASAPGKAKGERKRPSKWAVMLQEIADRTPNPPENEEDELEGVSETEIYPAEREGWLCFRRDSNKGVAVIDCPVDPGVAGGGQTVERRLEELCHDCSRHVLMSQRAVWAPVDQYVLQPDGEEKKTIMEGWLYVVESRPILGQGWVQRWVRATDAGLHYYTGREEGSLKKAKGSKVFNKDTVFIDEPGPGCNIPACPSAPYAFGFELKNPSQKFWLRTDREKDAVAWRAFFSTALDRFKVDDGEQDPNPAKWKARVSGLLQKLDEARAVAEAACRESDSARIQREEVEDLLRRAESDKTWAQAQAANAEQRTASMQEEVRKAELECQGLQQDIERILRDTEILEEQAAAMQRKAENSIKEAEAAKEETRQRLKDLQKELEEAEREKDEAQNRAREVFLRMREFEERTPKSQASSRSPLTYIPAWDRK